MAHPTLASGFPPVSCSIAYDYDTAFVSHPNDYQTAREQQEAIKMPLGSQFNLLPKENITSQYSATRVPQVSASSLDRVMQGYNTYIPVPTLSQVGGYVWSGGAYGIDKYLW